MKRPFLILIAALCFAAPSYAQTSEPPPAEPPAEPTAPAPEPEPETEPADTAPSREDLDQRVRILERKLELGAEQADAAAKTNPQVVAGKEGFEVKSADGSYRLRLRAYLQVDGRWFLDDEELPAPDSWVIRRARPIFEGTLFKFFDFRIMPDFGGNTTILYDAYIETRFSPWAKLRVGKFKPPVGLERLQGATDLLFVERAFPTNLVPSRDLGIQLGGDLAGGKLEYQAGMFNGVVDGGLSDQDSTDGKEVAARLVWKPFQPRDGSVPRHDLALGLALTRSDEEGTLTATGLPAFRNQGSSNYFVYRSDGTLAGTVRADGTRQRVAPQAWYYSGQFGALAEWVSSATEVRRNVDVAELENEAWQLQLSWVLTGETNAFRGVVPRRPFSPEVRGPGAWILAVRASGFEADPETFPTYADPARSVREAALVGAALSWNIVRSVRWTLEYDLVRYDGGAAAGSDRPDEQTVYLRFQVAY